MTDPNARESYFLVPGKDVDLPDCAEVWVRACEARDGDDSTSPEQRERVTFRLGSDRAGWIVARDGDDRIAGFALALPPEHGHPEDPDPGVYVSHIAVDPAAQGAGLGGRLLDALTAELAASGFRRSVLHVLENNRGARCVYEKHGWTKTGRTVTHRITGLRMIGYAKAL